MPHLDAVASMRLLRWEISAAAFSLRFIREAHVRTQGNLETAVEFCTASASTGVLSGASLALAGTGQKGSVFPRASIISNEPSQLAERFVHFAVLAWKAMRSTFFEPVQYGVVRHDNPSSRQFASPLSKNTASKSRFQSGLPDRELLHCPSLARFGYSQGANKRQSFVFSAA